MPQCLLTSISMISKSRQRLSNNDISHTGSLSSFLLNLCLTAHHLCRALETVVGVTEPGVTKHKKSIQFDSSWYIMVPWLLYRKFMNQELWAPHQPEVFKKYPSGTVLGFGPHTDFQLRKQQTQCRTMCFRHTEFWDPLQTHWAGVHSKASVDSLWLVNSSSQSLKFSTMLHRFSRHSPSSGLLATQCYGLENKGRLTSTTSKDFPKTFRGLPSWPAAASSHRRISHIRRLRDREFGNCDFEPSPTLETEWVAHHRIHRHIAPCRALHIHLLAFGLEFTGDTSLFESQNNIM